MEKANAIESIDATIIRGSGEVASSWASGIYYTKCFDKDGNLKWEDTINNVVTNVGKNLALDTFLAGVSYTVVGPFMGLISGVSYTGLPAVGDTMGSHPTWYEVSATTYFPTVAARITTNANWTAASNGSKQITTAISFSIITNPGVLKGCFLVFGTGAVSTLGSGAGTLYSAGVFSGGDKTVGISDLVQVSYTASL